MEMVGHFCMEINIEMSSPLFDLLPWPGQSCLLARRKLTSQAQLQCFNLGKACLKLPVALLDQSSCKASLDLDAGNSLLSVLKLRHQIMARDLNRTTVAALHTSMRLHGVPLVLQ